MLVSEPNTKLKAEEDNKRKRKRERELKEGIKTVVVVVGPMVTAQNLFIYQKRETRKIGRAHV